MTNDLSWTRFHLSWTIFHVSWTRFHLSFTRLHLSWTIFHLSWTRLHCLGPFFICLGPNSICLGPDSTCLGPESICLGPHFICLGPHFICLGLYSGCWIRVKILSDPIQCPIFSQGLGIDPMVSESICFVHFEHNPLLAHPAHARFVSGGTSHLCVGVGLQSSKSCMTVECSGHQCREESQEQSQHGSRSGAQSTRNAIPRRLAE